MQVHPLGQLVGPVYPDPPHCPYGDAVALVADVVVDDVVVDDDDDDFDDVTLVVVVVELCVIVDEVVLVDDVLVDCDKLPLGSPYQIPLPFVPTKTLP